MNKMSDGFWIAILRAVAPVVVDGHTDFEREIIDRGRVEACRVGTGQVLFESLNILTRQGLYMSIVEHHRIWLQGVNQIVKLIIFERAASLKIGIALVELVLRPITVEPHAGNFTVIRAQFAYLPMQESYIIRPGQSTFITETVGRMMPVQH